jgi:hypothetical protein
MKILSNILFTIFLTMLKTSLLAINPFTREVYQNRLYYNAPLKNGIQKETRDPPFTGLTHDSFTLEGIVDGEFSEPFACTIGHSVVEIIKIKNGLKYFILHGSGILINSGYIHKNVAENPDIIWTVPESSSIDNGSVLSLHAFKSLKNRDGSQPIDFYVFSYKIPGEKYLQY